MTGIENDIARVMAEHEHEAPGAADLLAALEPAESTPQRANLTGQTRHTRWYAPVAAAAAVAAIVLAAMWAGGALGTRPSRPVPSSALPLTCPAQHTGGALWVPASPHGVDGRTRLVPTRTPATAVICAYPGSNMKEQTGWALSGRRVLTGGLGSLAQLLAWQPRKIPSEAIACTAVGGNQTDFLIGLTYPGGGRLWVAAALDPNLCIGSANGEFSSQGDVGAAASRAFGTGHWPAIRLPSCRGNLEQAGRLGEATAMVPAGSTLVTICSGSHLLLRTASDRPLLRALNSLPSLPTTNACSGTPAGPGYLLYFSYPQGPPASVLVNDGCRPEIEGMGRQAESSASIAPIIRRMLGARG